MAIFTAGNISYLISRPGMPGGVPHDTNGLQTSGSAEHDKNPSKVIAGKALIGPSEGSKAGKEGMAMMAGMAAQNSDDSDGSGSSGGSGDSGAPTTPTNPTTPSPSDVSGQQYAAAPNTGVPTTNNSSATATTPTSATTSTTDTDKDKKTDTDNKDKNKKADADTDKNKKEEKNNTIELDQNTVVEDQDAILEKIKEINDKDAKNQLDLTQASMSLLFNNFVHFKDFIVQNFTKDKILSLCNELIDQIYPSDQVKVISMNKSNVQTSGNKAQDTQEQNHEQEQAPKDNQMMQPAQEENQMPEEMPQPMPDLAEQPQENQDQENNEE